MKSTKELLREKKDGAIWTNDEMTCFVQGMVTNKVTPPQIAAFLMAACIRGLSPDETAALTIAMTNSGAHFEKGTFQRPSIDKHSTGGVGDKVSLLVAPLAVACGLNVPMISGRGLGHTGGTLDKLESIRGFRTDLPFQEMKALLRDHHVFMAGQSKELVPADRITYALRDVTGTVENVGLITASILSKKMAEGLDGLVMDMKVGRGAFMRTYDDARRLAESLRDVCTSVGLPVTFVFSRMDSPLGKTVGNWLEIAEAEIALATSAQKDLAEVSIELVGRMLLLAKTYSTMEEAKAAVVNAWKSGAAHIVFHEMIARQGGRWIESVEHYAAIDPKEIVASSNGYLGAIDAHALAIAAMEAGAGRLDERDVIDPAAGLVLLHPSGTEVSAGEPLALAYATDRTKRDTLAERASNIFKIGTAPVEQEPSMIIDVWE